MSDVNGQIGQPLMREPDNFMKDLPEGTGIIRLLVLPPHGQMKIEAHGLTLLDVQARLAMAASSTDRELVCLRMEERAAERASAVRVASHLPKL